MAFDNNLPVRLVVATLDYPGARVEDVDASTLPKTFSVDENIIGKVVKFDGDAFAIEFQEL